MKKFIYCLIFLLLFFSFTVYAETLYQTVSSENISTGTILKKYTRFTDKGWLNIDVLEVDLSDRYTNLKLLTSTTGSGKTQNLKAMADSKNCLAGVNGDFFSASSGKGHPMGIAIDDGKVITSCYSGNLEKDEFATFLLAEDSSPFYEFISNEITLTSKKTKKSTKILEINKYPDTYNTPSIFTSDFGEYSIGSSDSINMTEMIVKNNKVTEIRNGKEAVLIPQDGYVVCSTNEGADFINNNFKVGTKVTLDIDTSFDIDDIEFAISGGAILLEDGKIPETFSSNISGTHPRTAIGTSKNDKTLYLVTVDGRQTSSVGMTQTELAEFLKEINVYSAINLDGGGSTTMVAKKLGDENLSVINSPSGGSLRAISNGIGIIYDAPNSSILSGITIEVSDTNVFKGKKREISVKGYNKYYSPVKIDQNKIEWSYDGVPVTVDDGFLTGDTVGMTMLKAKVGKVSSEIEINILSDPQELSITPKKVTLSNGKSVSFKIEAKNKNGYFSTLNNNEINFEIEKYINADNKESKIPSDAFFENKNFTSTSIGQYVISVSVGDIKSYALVTVNGDEELNLDTKLPNDIKGIDELQKHSELANEDSFTISLFDNVMLSNDLMIENLKSMKTIDSMNNSNVAIVTGKDNISNVTSKLIRCNGYSKETYKNSIFITLDASNSGLRATDSNEWNLIQQDIKNSKSENIFIVMNNSLDNFSDTKEARLFIDVLCELKRETGKNIWVLHKGQSIDYSMNRGIKYLSINTDVENVSEIPQNTNYILITVNGKNLTYEIKNVFDK